MSAPTAVLADRQTFLTALQKSGLLSAAQFAKAAASLAPAVQSAAEAAQYLVVTGALTQFQADRLLAGRSDGFVLGPYTILEQVGRGSMGRVFKAKHRSMNRFVAIKVLSPDATRSAAARESIQREVRAAAKLNHTNIVTAYDANEVGERFYLVLEYVDGPNLEQLVRERGPLPVGEACELVRQAACGLQHAHEQGMVHRNVKPANLLAARPSRAVPGCVVKIADFGIARVAPAAGARTPDYAAPEQARDPQHADHRADLYSLGCVFVYLLTGRPPFPGGTDAEVANRHQHESIPAIERLRPDVPPAVAEIIYRLLAKDPNARFQSAAAVASRLDALSAPAVTAHGDTSAVVNFNLPHVTLGSLPIASSFLTGLHAAPGDEASPWSQLTDDPSQACSATFSHDASITPLSLRMPAWERKRGRSSKALVGIGAALALAAIAGAALALRAGW